MARLQRCLPKFIYSLIYHTSLLGECLCAEATRSSPLNWAKLLLTVKGCAMLWYLKWQGWVRNTQSPCKSHHMELITSGLRIGHVLCQDGGQKYLALVLAQPSDKRHQQKRGSEDCGSIWLQWRITKKAVFLCSKHRNAKSKLDVRYQKQKHLAELGIGIPSWSSFHFYVSVIDFICCCHLTRLYCFIDLLQHITPVLWIATVDGKY